MMSTTFTPKAQQDTVSQTGKRSFSRISANKELDEDNSANIILDLNVQNIMPLIEHLKQQNEQLKHQRDQFQTELTKLKSLSEGVFEENKLMKLHYQQRTQDIKKIVATMSINMNEQIEDISHMSHMIKNHNFAIVKNIEIAKKWFEQQNFQIEAKQNQLAELAEKNTLLHEQIITKNVKIRKMEEKVEQLKKTKIKQDNLFKLEQEVGQLVQEVQMLRHVNNKKIKSAYQNQTRNLFEKPHFNAQNINVIQTIKSLVQEITQLKEDLKSFDRNLDTLNTYHKKLSQKSQKANQERERSALKIQNQENQIKSQKQIIYNNKNLYRQKQIKKSELQDLKYQLEKEFRKKQEKIGKIKADNYRQIEKKKTELKDKSVKLKLDHNAETEKSYNELNFKLKSELDNNNESLMELKSEYEDLEKQVDQLKATIKSMDNPVKQIIRMQYELQKLTI